MNIFKKRETTKNSKDYNKFLDLSNSLHDVDFYSTIKELCILEHTLKFYEKNTPDWQCEMDYYKRCQKTLLCKIGAYDSIRQEIIKLLNHTREDDCKNFVRPITSHEVIRGITRSIG